MSALSWISVLMLSLLVQGALANMTQPTAFQLLEKTDHKALLALPKQTLKSARNEFGESLLIRAIVTEKYETTKALLKADAADVNALDQNQNDALLYAAGQAQYEIVTSLIQKGAVLSRVYGEDQENIAFEAARMGDDQMLQLLGKARPELLSGLNRKGQGLIEIAVAAAQAGTALSLVKIPTAKKVISDARREIIKKALTKEKKNPRSQELLKLL